MNGVIYGQQSWPIRQFRMSPDIHRALRATMQHFQATWLLELSRAATEARLPLVPVPDKENVIQILPKKVLQIVGAG